MTNDLSDDGQAFVDAKSYMENDNNLVYDGDTNGLMTFFNSNGSLLSSSMSFGNLEADDLVDEPIGQAAGISFNPQVEMVRGDGTIKTIPLNMDGFFPSRQYESDPVDFSVEDDFSISLGGESDNSLLSKEIQGDVEDEELEGGDDDDHDNLQSQQQEQQQLAQQGPNNLLSQSVGNSVGHVTANAARAAK